MKPRLFILSLCILALVLSACNLPSNQTPTQSSPNVIFTAAAQTVAAKLTQDALLVPTTAVPATPIPAATQAPATTATSTTTPIPLPQGNTPQPVTPTSICDAAQFVADVNVLDGTPYTPGTAFIKTWRLKNIGTCTWDTAYSVVFDGGDAMGGPNNISLSGTVAPGGTVEVSIPLKAPLALNTYRGYWRLRNAAGVLLPVVDGYNGKSFYVEIQVKTETTNSGGGKFAVNSVGFNVTRSGTCASGKYVVTATIAANKAGKVTYTWVRSDGATGSGLDGSVDFADAGSKSISFEWTTSATGLWMELYIDNPNHQQFGRATLNCP
jgi:hypothetical protein